MQFRLRYKRSQAFNVGFRPSGLLVKMSPDSLNLLIILWSGGDEMLKFLVIVHCKMLFLNRWTICLPSCSNSAYTQSSIIHTPVSNESVHLWNVSERCFFFTFLNFPRLLLPLSQLWNVNSNGTILAKKNE